MKNTPITMLHKNLEDPTLLRQIALLHRETLPNSLPSVLGPRYLAALYSYVSSSETEQLAYATGHARVLGAATMSISPSTLTSRLLRKTPAARYLIYTLLKGKVPSSHPQTRLKTPELVWIFTSPTARGTGIARSLLVQLEAWLRTHGLGHYHLWTLRESAALGFYLRLGFKETQATERWVRLERCIGPTP